MLKRVTPMHVFCFHVLIFVSEPECLMEMSFEKTFDHLHVSQKDILIKCCITMLYQAATRTKPDVDCVLIKPKAHAIRLAWDLTRLYPKQIKHLYMMRHPVEYVRSMTSVFRSLLHPVVQHLMIYLSVDVGSMKEFIFRQFGNNKVNLTSHMTF